MAGLDTTFLNKATREKFIKVLKNNVYNKPVLMGELFSKGRVQNMTGRSLAWNVVAKKHTALGVYEGYDVLANQPVDPLVAASLSPANYYATVAISGDEERKNSGSMEKLLDMLKVQFENADRSLRDRMSTDVYGSVATLGGVTGAKQVINGINLAITSTTGVYAGINRATTGNEFWAANHDATAHALTNLDDPTHAEYLPAIMRTMFTNCSYDGVPDFIVTTKGIFDLYQTVAGVQNLQLFSDKADLGFKGVQFQGVRLMFDDYATTAGMFFLHLGDWSVFVYPETNFSMKEPGWQIPVDQDAKVCHITWSGQLRCDVPRQQGKISSIAIA